MKNYWKIVQAEFQERVFSSKKRIVKFVAICFVPFLYAFICIWAFWNPIPNIGKAPIAIVSNDQQVNLVSGVNKDGKPQIGGAYKYIKNGEEFLIDKTDFDFGILEPGDVVITYAGSKIEVDSTNFAVAKYSIVDNFLNSWKGNNVSGITFNDKNQKFTIAASEEMKLTNISYVNGEAAKKLAIDKPNNGGWETLDTKTYWAQIQIPSDISFNFINYLDKLSAQKFISSKKTSFLKNDLWSSFADNPINFWSTYKNNFLFGQFMYLFDNFKTGIIFETGPKVVADSLKEMINSITLDNIIPPVIGGAIKTALLEILDTIEAGIKLVPDFSNFLTSQIDGSNTNVYGIGLGQFFLCIGVWIGALMQTFIYDRKKRVESASNISFYFGKLTLMVATSLIQTTILMISILGLGFHVIGPSFGWLFLWMLFTATVFTIIINALWFSFRDQTVGKFLCIIFLVINLSSGWGTFAPFMQHSFFQVLSYIAPYTYSIHGQGAIIYGLSINGQNLIDNLIILQNLAVLLLFAMVFGIIGVFSAKNRCREMLYSTSSPKRLAIILKELNLNDFLRANQKPDWAKLATVDSKEIFNAVNEKFPEEVKLERYKKWEATQNLNNKELKTPKQASSSDDD
ncbi:hypothetical protein SSABA_v1c02630 [Spiroplasma sabaudiense Ar-1343]|uniref:ABC-2 type transporter transmembrane domain-containing protein n=1 Tax=Spiroplasma sabaudiense Ar-1343 TaxID=1276257 RepID=W6A9Y9_9MOLU|nr:ABC transporter permease [Spiroplasma sabaudiense]AHI53675.1 hypothetical protein SSABA_v1c02630 [Spiroplasma sabaudiense Ar-1343]